MKLLHLAIGTALLGFASGPTWASPLARGEGLGSGHLPLVEVQAVQKYKPANARKPSRRVNTKVPAYQRGSGQQTGGYARERIPQ